jgi:hypothetical protein
LSDAFVIERLAARHNRADFSCGVGALDQYLPAQAGQDARRNVANCFVAIGSDGETIAGYYTLSASNIPAWALPEKLRRRLPRYDMLPAALIGRLAVDARFRCRGLGSALIFDAGELAMRSEPAVYALAVDAKDGDAAAFYRRNNFAPFPDAALRLFLPIATFAKT